MEGDFALQGMFSNVQRHFFLSQFFIASRMLLTTSRQRPGTVLKVLQHTGQTPAPPTNSPLTPPPPTHTHTRKNYPTPSVNIAETEKPSTLVPKDLSLGTQLILSKSQPLLLILQSWHNAELSLVRKPPSSQLFSGTSCFARNLIQLVTTSASRERLPDQGCTLVVEL